MELTRLRVSGFKSFSEPVELQLEPGLTGVVGPNGCGKSNIVEALRWAMGESSARGLRGDGMEDVIFNGSAVRPAHDVAEVRLRLRGRPEGLAGFAEVGEVEVARRIGRGTGSVYRINGREARARDVQLLFADAGAGARSPAIVGQGQIGFIVDSKPVERRRLLEDAAGIGGLQARRREAELRLEATRANLQRVLDLLASQEARLAELGKQGRQARRYREIAAELRRAEAHLLLARHAEASRRATAANEEVAALGADHDRREQAAAALRGSRAAAAARLPPLREDAAARQARATGMRERLASLRDATGREATHLAALARQRDEAAQDLARCERTGADLVGAIRALGEEAKALAAAHEAMGGALRAPVAADESAAAAMAAAQDAARVAVGLAAEAAAQHDSARERTDALRRRAGAVAAELAALPAVEELQHQAGLAEGALADAERRVAVARDGLAGASAELAELGPAREAQLAAARAAERDLADRRAELAAADLRRREAAAGLARLRERRAALERAALRLTERRANLARRRELLDQGASDADPGRCQAALATAERELAVADSVLDVARAAQRDAERARAEATAHDRELGRSADALEAEIRVLESLAPAGEAGGGLLDSMGVPEDLALAVAAALGDDLLAGTDPDAPRRWSGRSGDLPPPALPEGVPALLGMVGAPAPLGPRLARTGLVAGDAAEALLPRLAPGHRLVSRDGGLWRWDGFVRAPGAEDSATARVRHRLRLHAAREELAALGLERAATEARAVAVERAVQAARATLTEAESRWRAADAAQVRARQRDDEALALAERRAAEALQVECEAGALASEAAELEREGVEIGAVAGLGAEAEDAAAAAAEAEAMVGNAERRLAAAEAEAWRVETAHAAAHRARQAQEEVVARAVAALDEARSVAGAAARRAAEQQADRRARAGALERERGELAAALAEAERSVAAAQALAGVRAGERAAALGAGADAEAARRVSADRLLAARAEVAASERRAAEVARATADTRARRDEAERFSAELRQRLERLAGELAQAERERRSDPAALAQVERELAAAAAAEAAGRAELDRQEAAAPALEAEAAAADATLAGLRQRLAVAQAERGHAHEALAATVAAVRERLQQEPLSLLADEATRAAVAAADPEELNARLARLRASRDRLGPVNLRADAESAELEASVAETRARQAELQQAVDRLRAGIGTLDREARERLAAAFEAVDGHFRRLFATLFDGGRAHLRLAGADDPLEAGLELEASPPGKKLSSISLLSGGEKTLTALALVFAFFLAQPSPLCVLDEVDAPLDDANVDRFVDLMQAIARATGTRFLVVTHHPLTMARMDRLYGVTMTERGVSRLVSVALEQALELRATA